MFSSPTLLLAGIYCGPIVITAIRSTGPGKVRDQITNRKSMEHANRLRPFKNPKDLTKEKIESFAATELNYMQKLI